MYAHIYLGKLVRCTLHNMYVCVCVRVHTRGQMEYMMHDEKEEKKNNLLDGWMDGRLKSHSLVAG